MQARQRWTPQFSPAQSALHILHMKSLESVASQSGNDRSDLSGGPAKPAHVEQDKRVRPNDNFRALQASFSPGRQSHQNVALETFWYNCAKRIESSLKLRRARKNVLFSHRQSGRGGGMCRRGSGNAHAALDHRSRIEGGAWQGDEKRGPPRPLPPRWRPLL